jgi:Family of unknown function (DUF5333)
MICVKGYGFKTALVAGAWVIGTTLATAQPAMPLADEPHINEQLIAAAVGDVIRKTCPSISARMVTVYFKAKELEDYARDAGYREDEVKAFLKDKSEKARIKAMALEYMVANGVVEGDVDSYCTLGNSEIRKDSPIGVLLRSN